MTEGKNDPENIEENSRLLAISTVPSEYGSSTTAENLIKMGVENEQKVLTQYIASLAAAGGALAAGICLGWTSLTGPEVKGGVFGFPVTENEFSWVGSSMNLGAAFVCIPIGFLINAIGRKLSMLLLVLPFTVGWMLLIFAQSVVMLYIARFLLGIAGGAFCVTAPMYIGEISSKDIRGTLGSFFQLLITVGILLSYALGMALKVIPFSIVCAVIPLIFGLVFLFMPETPTYLVSKGRSESATKSIKWLRGDEYNAENELTELQAEDANIKANSVSVFNALFRRNTLKSLFISLGLMFFQQMCGINAVIFYTGDIFKDADTGIDQGLATILVGVMQVIATFVSVMCVDKLGRRVLLLLSGSLMMICTLLMGVYFYMLTDDSESVKNIGWLPVVCLCVFITMFSMGFGPVPWLMMGELFAADIKGPAGSIAGTFNWLLAFLITKTFVTLKQSLGNGETFWFFSGFTLLGIFFVWFCVPETKGKSLQEIQNEIGASGLSNTGNQKN